MKFGFYSPYLDTFGGGERYMLTLASHFSKNHEVNIFWEDNSIKAPLSKFLKIDLSSTNFVSNIFKQNIKSKIFSSKNYDFIFVLSDGSIPLIFSKKSVLHFQVPFVFPKPNLQTRLKLSRYTKIVTNSFFTKTFIDKSFNINSEVIYPPVDLKNLKAERKENIILSVGRFSSNQLHPKRQEILIDVFKEVYKKTSNWKLYLVGQAKKEDQKYIRFLQRQTRGLAIRIFKNLPNEKLRHLYSISSIYWYATGFGRDEQKSPQSMEHFGISTVEAQASGSVPVVYGAGGQKEIVKDGENGLLWYTKTQLYESTFKLINNLSLRKKLSQKAQKDSKNFSQENFLKAYEKIIL